MRVLATLHLADLFREPRMTLPTQSDYAKIPRFLAGAWPSPIPQRFIVQPGEHAQLSDIVDLDNHWDHVVIDTEYDRDDKTLITIGVGLRRGSVFTGFQAHQWPRLQPWVRDMLTDAIRRLAMNNPVVFQNTLADVPVMERNGLLDAEHIARILRTVEDTMLAHAVLWSEWPHTLEFLASMYGELEKLKHLAGVDPLLYNWGDVCDTDSAWLRLKAELANDPPSEHVYRTQSLPLLPVLLKAKKRGIRIHRERVETAAVELEVRKTSAQYLATAWMGWAFPLGSVGGTGKIADYLYNSAGMPQQFKRGGKFKGKKKVTVDADAIASLRAAIEPIPDFEEEERNGLSVDLAIDRCLAGADPILETRVVYADATQSLSHYIEPAIKALGHDGRFYPEFLIHAQANARWSTNNPPLAQLPEDLRDIIYPDDGYVWLGWDWDQIELRINAEQCNDLPTLEAFEPLWCMDCGHKHTRLNVANGLVGGRGLLLRHAEDKANSFSRHYGSGHGSTGGEDSFGPRALHETDGHGQEGLSGNSAERSGCGMGVSVGSGNESPSSTTNSKSHDAVACASCGCVGQRLGPADIHTLNMCDCFGFPYPPARVKPWAAEINRDWITALTFQGKDDPRRVFAKRFVYRLDYGGDPENAGDIPGAQALGFIGREGSARLVQASQRYLAAHPAKAQSRMEVARVALQSSIARALDGRRRRLTGDRVKKIRDAFDFPMQAGVSGWFNLTVILIEAELPWLEWMYGMHDSQKWQCPEARAAETWPRLRAIVERKLEINGRETNFPATFKQECVVHKDCLGPPKVRRMAA